MTQTARCRDLQTAIFKRPQCWLRGIISQTPVQRERLLWRFTLACERLPGMTDGGRFAPHALQHHGVPPYGVLNGKNRPGPVVHGRCRECRLSDRKPVVQLRRSVRLLIAKATWSVDRHRARGVHLER
jgi:hypothetical protein